MDADYRNDKVAGRSITGFFSMVRSTSTTWSSKRQTEVQTSTFSAKFTGMKKVVKESVVFCYHLRSVGIKVYKPTPLFVDNMSVVFNAKNPRSTLNKKAEALSYHF